MDTDKIIQDLNRRFAAPLPEFYQRRIIFWYDEDKEFEDKLDEVVLENAKVIALTGNNAFSVKKLDVYKRQVSQRTTLRMPMRTVLAEKSSLPMKRNSVRL